MGCNSTKSKEYKGFENGKPDFKADEIVKQFDRGNGYLFRLVNKSKKQWAYYNDSKEFNMHVQVTFGPDSHIKALDNTKLEMLENGEYLATVVVRPGKTERFIQGHVNGFRSKMDAYALDGHQVPQVVS